MSEPSSGAEAETGPYSASRLAEDIRAAIDRGELRPGDQISTAAELSAQYGINKNTASRAITDLKAAGVLSGLAGGRTRVRVRPPRVKRHNVRYQREKDEIRLSADDRAQYGVAEADSGLSLSDLYEDTYKYEVVDGPADVRAIFRVPEDAKLLRRTHRRRHAIGAGASGSTSYIPYELAAQNPDLLDDSREPWPGGTMHQLHTVGVELDHIDDHVEATMPTKEEQQLLDIPPGVPLLRVRKISWSTDDEAVEISDIPLPGDRAELIFTTQLNRWS